MDKSKKLEDMSLGKLVHKLVGLRDECKKKLVDEQHPRPETWEKYGGIHAFNQQVNREYEQTLKELISKIDEKERLYMSKR